MTARCLFTMLVTVLTIQNVQADEETRPSPLTPISQTHRDILFYHPDAPVFLRVHINVDGKPLDHQWTVWLKSIFAELDSDDNKRLAAEEVTAGPTGRSLDARRLAADSGLWSADRTPLDQAVTFDELATYLIARQRGPLQPPGAVTTPVNSNQAGERLFQLLDRDGDDALSDSEFALAMKTLRRRDLDDDGSISIGELTTIQGMNAVASRQPAARNEVRFVSLVPGLAPLSIVKEIERRYGRMPKTEYEERPTLSRGLGADEIGVSSDVFAHMDLDSDGTLDRTELRHLIRNPQPTIEVIVRLGKRNPEQPLIETVGSPAHGNIELRRALNGLVSIVYNNIQVELVEASSEGEGARQYLKRQYSAGDRDRNGYIDIDEAQQNRVFRNTFAQFDDDSDGKLFEEELYKVFDSQAAAAGCRTQVSVRDCGRDLMEILNVDRNQSLAQSEIAAAARRVDLWDSNGDSMISSSEIPQLYQITFGPGQPQIPGLQVPGQAATMQANQSGSAATAPFWFGKLDRNSDGELSRREFPGTRAEFQSLDRNSDGSVTAVEAEFVK